MGQCQTSSVPTDAPNPSTSDLGGQNTVQIGCGMAGSVRNSVKCPDGYVSGGEGNTCYYCQMLKPGGKGPAGPGYAADPNRQVTGTIIGKRLICNKISSLPLSPPSGPFPLLPPSLPAPSPLPPAEAPLSPPSAPFPALSPSPSSPSSPPLPPVETALSPPSTPSTPDAAVAQSTPSEEKSKLVLYAGIGAGVLVCMIILIIGYFMIK